MKARTSWLVLSRSFKNWRLHFWTSNRVLSEFMDICFPLADSFFRLTWLLPLPVLLIINSTIGEGRKGKVGDVFGCRSDGIELSGASEEV